MSALLLAITSYRGMLFLQPHTHAVAHAVTNSALVFIPIALAEEFFFRGYLQETAFANLWGERGWRGLSCKNLTAAFLFGLAHFIALDWATGVLTFFGGVLVGWLTEHSARSIGPAVFLHAAHQIAFAWFVPMWNLNVFSLIL
jgi:membrane protease YdiL (CAAX protease family)